MTKQQHVHPSEYDRLQAEWNARYHVVREGMMWHVKCGTGTGSLMSFISKREAERCAAVLLTAFRDGMYVVESKLRGGGRYA